MENLLFLCHRIPYPPNKGDKIRSFHFLQFLATRYRVHLGTFIDDPADEVWRDKINDYCADSCVVGMNSALRKVGSLRGLFTGEALGLPYYRDATLALWVQRTLSYARPSRIFVFSSTMAQYIPSALPAGTRTIVDFVDVDSEKWRAYADAKPGPLNWIYRREARLLKAFEAVTARRVTASVFVSEPEARLFNSLLDPPIDSVCHVENGVDLQYFCPDETLQSPYEQGKRVCVFTGAMDYWANIDATRWFAREIFPRIRESVGNAEFWIVGSNPSAQVLALDALPGVRVTGSVRDVRPYLQHADVVVAPLRIARGIQNKVLEGMAMNKPVIGTSAAFEGIHAEESPSLYTADDAEAFSRATLALLIAGSTTEQHTLRRYVERTHDWNFNLPKLLPLLEPDPT